MAFRIPRNFRLPPWILPKIFIFYTVLTYTFVILSSKQKHTTGTHTHTWPATTTNKKQLCTSHLLLMVISLAQTLLSCAKFRLLRVIKKDIILLTLGWLWGRPQALLQRRNFLKRSRWFGKRHKTDAFTKLGEPTIRAVPYRQCLAGISNAFSVSGHLSRGFTVPPNKACLVCATPTGTYRVQSLGFPKIVY